MEFIKINNNKIKVMLSYEDLMELNLFNYGTFDIECLINIIVLAAEYECDFYLDKSKYIVEIKLLSNKGMIVYITKNYKQIKNNDYLIYEFTDFYDIVHISKLIDSDFNGESKIYYYKNLYYLILRPELKVNIKKVEAHLSEYGIKSNNNLLFLNLIYEYGKVITNKNAIEFVKKL